MINEENLIGNFKNRSRKNPKNRTSGVLSINNIENETKFYVMGGKKAILRDKEKVS